MWSVEEFLNLVTVRDEDTVIFNMTVDFNDLISNNIGVEFLNDLVSEFVDKGHLLTDIVYKPIAVSGFTLLIEVTANAEDLFLEEGV